VAATLRAEIRSASTRNPDSAPMTARSGAGSGDRFAATPSGRATAPDCDPAALPDSDVAAAIAPLRARLDAGLDGRLPTPALPDRPAARDR